MESKLRLILNDLKNSLDNIDDKSIHRARDAMEKRVVKKRCFNKLKDIDKKFNVCKRVNVFLDLCGGPGQFANYIHSTNFDCKGYGVTLRGKLDYNYNHENFKKIYGYKNSGDIFDESVILELNLMCGKKCELVVADGATDVRGNENDQEILTLPLLAQECKIILNSLKPGGDCVLKIFDTFHSETKILLKDFAANFEFCTVFKPLHSRAANSERYLIGKNRLTERKEHKNFTLNTVKFALKQKRALKKLLNILQNGTNVPKKFAAS
ncbi:mtase-1 [Cryptophlebia peltastica nucleopolyhedrovirus]|uniref:Mtase-1 n=1 Tax=Cryptophlebia peltastica nucleopolyhedrovirus TaxID=2304025 RepID=A0A346RNS3_9ABAC|nr:mtase-1 [Cryptophlebia peltastica nucleopolyhedrovirus]AXS67720.1 mtase-1 [Cryptophlebia peltastica nucleopolyhedrovirus]